MRIETTSYEVDGGMWFRWDIDDWTYFQIRPNGALVRTDEKPGRIDLW